VNRFVEKPASHVAASLLASGGLWSSFMLACGGAELVELFAATVPRLHEELTGAFAEGTPITRPAWLLSLYARAPFADFSRDVLEHCADRARVLAVPACGWSDLGTPARLSTFGLAMVRPTIAGARRLPRPMVVATAAAT
jgi:mannose-1-phosphate guanylyltransferase